MSVCDVRGQRTSGQRAVGKRLSDEQKRRPRYSCHPPAIGSQTARGASFVTSGLNVVSSTCSFGYLTGGQGFGSAPDTLRKCSHRHTQPRPPGMRRKAGCLGQLGLTLVCGGEWAWRDRAGGRAQRVSVAGERSLDLLCVEAHLCLLQMVRRLPATATPAPLSGVSLESSCDRP